MEAEEKCEDNKGQYNSKKKERKTNNDRKNI